MATTKKGSAESTKAKKLPGSGKKRRRDEDVEAVESAEVEVEAEEPKSKKGGKGGKGKAAAEASTNGHHGEGTKHDPRVAAVMLDQIKVVKGLNPRSDFGDLKQLTASIKKDGLLQSLTIRPKLNKKGEEVADEYELLFGGKRFEALNQLGWKKPIPVQIRTDLYDDNEARAAAVAENSGDTRTELSPLDEAKVFKSLQDAGWTQSQIGKACNRSAMHVSRTTGLLATPKDVQTMLADGRISKMAALEITKLDESVQKKVAKRVRERADETPKGVTEDDVKRIANEVREETGAKSARSAGKTRGTGTATADSGKVNIWLGRREIKASMEDLMAEWIDVTNSEEVDDDEKEVRDVAIKNRLLALFVVTGELRNIVEDSDENLIDSEDFSASFDALYEQVNAAVEEDTEDGEEYEDADDDEGDEGDDEDADEDADEDEDAEEGSDE